MAKKIKVLCMVCGWVEEDQTEILDCEEDMQGADVVTFKCKCGKKGKSRRYG